MRIALDVARIRENIGHSLFVLPRRGGKTRCHSAGTLQHMLHLLDEAAHMVRRCGIGVELAKCNIGQ